MDDSVVKRRRGRPKKMGSFDKSFRFVGSEEHKYMRGALQDELNKNSGEVFREALEMFYKLKTK